MKEYMKRHIIYLPIIISVLMMPSCSIFDNSADYPDWDGWSNPPLGITIEVDAPAIVSKTDALYYRVILTNQFNQKISVGAGPSLSNKLEFDLAIVNSRGQLIWERFPRDAIFNSKMYGTILEPGESFVMEDTWELLDLHGERIPAGSYKLFGGLNLVEVNFWENGEIVKTESFINEDRPYGSIPLLVEVQ